MRATTRHPGSRTPFAAAVLALTATSVATQPAIAQAANTAAYVTPFEEAAAKAGADQSSYRIDYLLLPMRDGTRLSTVVLRPRAPGKYPTIMVRTPYSPAIEFMGLQALYGELLKRGYAFVFQNERGSGWSEGTFHLLGNAADDGYDTLNWIAAQPWSSGKVGTSGCSSSGDNQVRLGTLQNPAHAAIVTMSSGTSMGGIPGVPDYGGLTRNGVPQYSAWATWFFEYGQAERPKLPAGLSDAEVGRALRFYALTNTPSSEAALAAATKSLQLLPSADVLSRLGSPASDYDQFIAAPPADPEAYAHLDVLTPRDTGSTPQIIIDAWGDVAPYEQVKLFEYMQAKPHQYLIMAPTRHCGMLRATENTMLGDRPIGDARLPYLTILANWYDWQVKGDASAWKAMPKVQTYLMGAEGWLTGEHWPLAQTKLSKLFLDSGGKANTASGDGKLIPAASAAGSDMFVADPDDPVPSLGDGIFGPPVADQSPVEKRPDVLVYSTPPLQKGLSIVGDLNLVAFISADVKDTDLSVKVEDVYPDGKAYNVTSTMIRLRYRDGLAKPELLQPGSVYRIDIRGMTTSNYFAPGHRLRLQVSGSNFPAFERNLNTGGNNATETKGVTAHVRLLHGGSNASYLQFREYTGPLPKKASGS